MVSKAGESAYFSNTLQRSGERGGSVVECRTPEREVRRSRPTAAVLCPWARHFTPRKYWLITQEAMAPSRHDWKIVDWDVKPQHNQPTPEIGKLSQNPDNHDLWGELTGMHDKAHTLIIIIFWVLWLSRLFHSFWAKMIRVCYRIRYKTWFLMY